MRGGGRCEVEGVRGGGRCERERKAEDDVEREMGERGLKMKDAQECEKWRKLMIVVFVFLNGPQHTTSFGPK